MLVLYGFGVCRLIWLCLCVGVVYERVVCVGVLCVWCECGV